MKHSYMKIIYVCIYIYASTTHNFEICSVTSRFDNKRVIPRCLGRKKGNLGGNSKGEPYSFEDGPYSFEDKT